MFKKNIMNSLVKTPVFILLGIFYFSIELFAQPEMTHLDLPGVGTTQTFAFLTMNAEFDLVSGPNQSWTFDFINSESETNKEYLSAASVPAASLVEGCNLVVATSYPGIEDVTYEFFSLTPDSWQILALSSSPDFIEEFLLSPETIEEFPINESTSNSETFVSSFTQFLGESDIDSVRYVSYLTSIKEVDGWGTFTLYGVSYPTLKQLNTDASIDSVFYFMNGAWSFFEAYEFVESSHQFISPEAGGVFLSITEYEEEGIMWNVNYLKNTFVTGDPKFNIGKGLVVYPNPASSRVHIISPSPSSKKRTAVVADILGKPVISQDFGTETLGTIDISGLKKGVYFVGLSDMNLKPQKLIVE
jgi:hypothetical protein